MTIAARPSPPGELIALVRAEGACAPATDETVDVAGAAPHAAQRLRLGADFRRRRDNGPAVDQEHSGQARTADEPAAHH